VLHILGDQQENATFREIIQQVKADVEQGSTFADALGKHPKPFDALYVNLVAAGEIGGILDTILNRLAVYLEKADALARKVRGAMVYPATVLVVRGRRDGADADQDHPDLRGDVHRLRGTLPGPTQAVINMSHWMQSGWSGSCSVAPSRSRASSRRAGACRASAAARTRSRSSCRSSGRCCARSR